ncbi:MAG: substrate-binding domain-containing protein [Armatimonadota bacterium]|nr:substrate-binding domain-containing protein [Armatimonadota bacterium]MDR7444631.1 substrate-binding domain-containing protein [Armatimonadota bacterium]MDR7569457.1 substrate-binding domain-containing protein [Armatimonadota bacterium]MDR7613660.1 substrate-binding domain-containing protein [Armatimonadota bacterium]
MGRRVAAELQSHVRAVRESRGLSQAELARLAGLSRQALSAIEAGRYVPNTAVALRLAEALGCAVEDLFRVPTTPTVRARLAGPASIPRVRLGRLRSELVAWPLEGPLAAQPADGTVVSRKGHRAAVALLGGRGDVERTVFVAGCDPALRIAGSLAETSGRVRVHWIPTSSAAALQALGEGLVHAAGTHLHPPGDPEGTQTIRHALGRAPALVVTLARWVEGVMLRPGARIRSAEDLLRPGVRVVNREQGSGSRLVFDQWLRGAGIPVDSLEGYRRELSGHLAVAEAVATGLADAGPGVLPVARLFGLDFLPLAEHRYDLVVPEDLTDREPVRVLLDVVAGRRFREELAAIGGYDPAPAGSVRKLGEIAG